MMRVVLALTLLLSSAACAGDAAWGDAAVQPCDAGIHGDDITRLGAENTASYAQGDLRVGLLNDPDSEAGARLLVLGPLRDAGGQPQCRLVGVAGGGGFGTIDFAGRSASYNPATGLTLSFSVDDPGLGAGDEGQFLLGVRIHLGNGQIVTQGMK